MTEDEKKRAIENLFASGISNTKMLVETIVNLEAIIIGKLYGIPPSEVYLAISTDVLRKNPYSE